jgi:arylsulfatase A-like enzyme
MTSSKVQAILNEIHGKRSDGTGAAPVPAIFGMNFQAVSVGQKLVDPIKSCQRNPTSTCDPAYVPGGYMPGTLAFTPQLAQALAYVDGALGSMVDALRGEGLLQSTALIISAKHGQSPIDPAKLAKIGDQVTSVLTAAGIQVAQDTTDDVALVWLKDQHQSTAAVGALQADKAGANTARIDFIVAGAGLAERFGNPLSNSRTPDLIVQPIPGTIYTRSQAKVAEHGGFADDDTHVALLVVDGSRRVDRARDDAQDRHVSAPVRTTQIAPTIVAFLGLDPSALESVRSERTRVLPL